ncbi:chaperone NapD [Desulforhopalus singaporensis]|uniref:Periplasmic nitrate reductase chaperone NapD n=1 Tax=Desulforhopalus singaporensis TaxID=91360 RepID=A0A1H0THC2_9BACT|nr:chaperone NapD [Desulforhopalus singaporensis]SDP53231.1 periplasmic nitrate reductase chaperone NapD [Desulforhopalus singaporensis]
MPISGVVITGAAEKKQGLLERLGRLSGLEVYGDDDQGNIVAVLDTASSEAMEMLIDRINRDKDVFNVGVTYLNTEDEADRMTLETAVARPFGFKNPL